MKWILLICVASLCVGFYLEYVEHLLPCVLCIMQRVAYAAVAVFAGLYCVLQRHRLARILLRITAFLSASAGLYFAGKQVYIESLPPELRPSCSIPLHSLIEHQQWLDALWLALQGTSDCGTKSMIFLDMSLAWWSGCLFLLLLGLLIWGSLITRHR